MDCKECKYKKAIDEAEVVEKKDLERRKCSVCNNRGYFTRTRLGRTSTISCDHCRRHNRTQSEYEGFNQAVNLHRPLIASKDLKIAELEEALKAYKQTCKEQTEALNRLDGIANKSIEQAKTIEELKKDCNKELIAEYMDLVKAQAEKITELENKLKEK